MVALKVVAHWQLADDSKFIIIMVLFIGWWQW
jgi:hypothetical protein